MYFKSVNVKGNLFKQINYSVFSNENLTKAVPMLD